MCNPCWAIAMIDCPNMLMIGSAARNVGKTEFACRLIARIALEVPVIGVKITLTHGSEEGLLKDGFRLSEETGADTSKDTLRMLRAGASRVFWLQVVQESLGRAVDALLAAIPSGSAIVCESSSAREFVRPGVFLVVREAGFGEIKESCRKVIGLADRVITFYGDGWDFAPDQCYWAQGRWFIPFEASAAILAGGQSRRMGQDKSLLPIDGQPMIAHIAAQLSPLFPELLIGSNDPARHAFLNLPLVADREAGQGPLMGILSCLEASRHELLFVTACDIPQMPLAFIRDMLELAADKDVVIPMTADGRYEPLFAVYRKSLIPRAREILAQGGRRIIELLEGQRHACPIMPPAVLRNLNTPEDYRQFSGDRLD